ncbi:hypothetical protein SAVIM338S_01902 [Streptomyces avidinii]
MPDPSRPSLPEPPAAPPEPQPAKPFWGRATVIAPMSACVLALIAGIAVTVTGGSDDGGPSAAVTSSGPAADPSAGAGAPAGPVSVSHLKPSSHGLLDGKYTMPTVWTNPLDGPADFYGAVRFRDAAGNLIGKRGTFVLYDVPPGSGEGNKGTFSLDFAGLGIKDASEIKDAFFSTVHAYRVSNGDKTVRMGWENMRLRDLGLADDGVYAAEAGRSQAARELEEKLPGAREFMALAAKNGWAPKTPGIGYGDEPEIPVDDSLLAGDRALQYAVKKTYQAEAVLREKGWITFRDDVISELRAADPESNAAWAIFTEGVRLFRPGLAEEVKRAVRERETGFESRGTMVVGEDIKPGTYRTTAPKGELFKNAYWERTSKSGAIIANDFVTSAREVTVTIAPGDGQFTSEDFGFWVKVS